MFLESFKVCSRKIEGHFIQVFCGVQECSKEVQWVFEESFKGVSRMVQESVKGASRVSKKIERVFQGSFKDVLYTSVKGVKEGVMCFKVYFKKTYFALSPTAS